MLHNIQKIIFCRAVEGQYSTILVIIVMRLIVLMWNRMCHRFVNPDQEWVQAVINQSHPPTYPWKRWWLWWISARQTNFYELINFVSNIWQHDKLSILWQTIQQWCLDLGNRILGALIGECNKTFWVLWKESQKKHPFFWVPKGLASYCKAETTFTFHFSILTLSNASLGISNRDIKSESGISFAIASQPL